MSFADLGLSDELLKAVQDSGYTEPTPIQRQAIPSVLMGRDLIGIAQTGTGKTASFVLPMIDILAHGRSRARMPRSLILEPTRELAAQVAENFEKYGKYHKLSMALLIGGVSMGDQVKALEKGVDVLIATPGRLMDLFGRGNILLTGCNLLKAKRSIPPLSSAIGRRQCGNWRKVFGGTDMRLAKSTAIWISPLALPSWIASRMATSTSWLPLMLRRAGWMSKGFPTSSISTRPGTLMIMYIASAERAGQGPPARLTPLRRKTTLRRSRI